MNTAYTRKKIPGARVFDVSTRRIIEQFGLDGPVCVIQSADNKLDETIISGYRELFRETMDNPELISLADDLCGQEFPEKHRQLLDTFGLVICGHVLEHIERPWDAAKNIELLIRPGGHLRYSGSWVWGYHPYPDDYWRISFPGLSVLFPNLEWLDGWYSSTNKGVGVKIHDLKMERHFFQQTDSELTPLGEVITNRSMPYLKVEAIGRKP